MLRYKTETRPGLVALYDIRPGGRANIFCPATDPLPWGTEWPKFNQLEMVTTFTYKPSLVRISAHNFELSW